MVSIIDPLQLYIFIIINPCSSVSNPCPSVVNRNPRTPGTTFPLDPAAVAEEAQHGDGQGEHTQQNVPDIMVALAARDKHVHTKEAGYYRQRHHDNGYNGQNGYDFTGPAIDY